MGVANSFVDFDMPDHSLVIGNPAVIKNKQNVTDDYVLYGWRKSIDNS